MGRVGLNPEVSEGTRDANARIDDAVGMVTDALRAKYAKHSFKPRVEFRFVIDGRYLTRTAMAYETLACALSREYAFADFAVQIFAEDVAEYERESALLKSARKKKLALEKGRQHEHENRKG